MVQGLVHQGGHTSIRDSRIQTQDIRGLRDGGCRVELLVSQRRARVNRIVKYRTGKERGKRTMGEDRE
jgi:hypothetical protein